MKKLLQKLVPLVLLLLMTLSSGLLAAGESVSYSGHVEGIGWMNYVSDGALAGTTGQAKRMEALKIKLSGFPEDSHIEYAPHVEDYGWRDYVRDDQIAGTTGEAKRVEAVKIRLTGEAAKTHDIYYRTHLSDFGWLGWAKNDQVSGSSGYAKRMEAIEIVLVPKDSPAPGPTGSASIEKDKIEGGSNGLDENTGINYSAYVRTLGWQNPVGNGGAAGTTGQTLPIEAVKAKLINLDGNIVYNTHVRNIGWVGESKNDQESGHIADDSHIEAIAFNLTGNIANQYDIYYSTHVTNIGWMGWAKNGEVAGTTGGDRPIEAYIIQLVPKTGKAPVGNGPAFQDLSPVVAQPGKRTIQNFLATALLPVGTTNYIFGGGWNAEDNGAGPGATCIGVLPRWKEFFDQQNASYDYNKTKFQIMDGLDCSGYVGWAVYNTLNTTPNGPGEVYYADEQAQIFAQKGYGTYTPRSQIQSFDPGDIVSLLNDGHVYICLGNMPDGSVLLAHSSPPGVMITGLKDPYGNPTQATALAHEYMKRYYPEYYNRYNNQLDRNSTTYLTSVGKFTWNPNVVGDPEGIRYKHADEVLKILFNEK